MRRARRSSSRPAAARGRSASIRSCPNRPKTQRRPVPARERGAGGRAKKAVRRSGSNGHEEADRPIRGGGALEDRRRPAPDPDPRAHGPRRACSRCPSAPAEEGAQVIVLPRVPGSCPSARCSTRSSATSASGAPGAALRHAARCATAQAGRWPARRPRSDGRSSSLVTTASTRAVPADPGARLRGARVDVRRRGRLCRPRRSLELALDASLTLAPLVIVASVDGPCARRRRLTARAPSSTSARSSREGGAARTCSSPTCSGAVARAPRAFPNRRQCCCSGSPLIAARRRRRLPG